MKSNLTPVQQREQHSANLSTLRYFPLLTDGWAAYDVTVKDSRIFKFKKRVMMMLNVLFAAVLRQRFGEYQSDEKIDTTFMFALSK